MKKALMLISLTALCITWVSCGPAEKEPQTPKNVLAYIDVKDKGQLWFQLYPDKAPKGVRFFSRLANEDFYKGLKIWHVSQLGLIQSGCPNNDGTGYYVDSTDKRVFIKEEIDTSLTHKRGTISLLNFGRPWTTSSQFLICRKPVPQLDGRYTIIGDIIRGEEILDEIKKGDVIVDVGIKEEY